uniref:Uncharacterized protein n=1 Tax=Anopheles farauti TaxID=69004 RepID=A0A182Q690_9DIPT
MAFRRASYCCLWVLLLLYLAATLAAGTTGGPQPQPSRGRSSNPSPRLPRTSASQLSAQNNTSTTRGSTSKNLTSSTATGSQAAQSRGNYRTRSKLILSSVVISSDASVACLSDRSQDCGEAFAGSSTALNRFFSSSFAMML